VFLEALASGCFPLGTYFGGMAASIDAVSADLPPEQADLMKIRPAVDATVEDIVSKVSGVLRLGRTPTRKLREAAVDRYDWRFVTRRLSRELHALADGQ